MVREYIGLCFDVCHQAVEFEDVSESINLFVKHGIRINKVHITNAAELEDPANNHEGREALLRFVEPRYLHQTYAQFSDGRVESRVDLLEADIRKTPADDFLTAERWRVHFHVPVFAETLGPLKTTRSDLASALRRVAQLDYSPHLEVETYTWPVMPGSESGPQNTLADRIAMELQSAGELLRESSESPN